MSCKFLGFILGIDAATEPLHFWFLGQLRSIVESIENLPARAAHLWHEAMGWLACRFLDLHDVSQPVALRRMGRKGLALSMVLLLALSGLTVGQAGSDAHAWFRLLWLLGIAFAAGAMGLWILARQSETQDSSRTKTLGALYALLLAAVFSFPVLAIAQTEPNLQIGFHPYGSYHGSGIESIGLMNGNLVVHIPYPYHYPQRGSSLDDLFFAVMNSKTWTVGTYVPPGNVQPSSPYWGMNDQWNPATIAYAETLVPILRRIYEHDTDDQGNSTYSAYGYSLTTWDGARHSLMDTSNGAFNVFEATDGSGWRVQLNTTDANGTPQGGVILDSKGNQYSFSGFGMGRCTRTVNDPPPPGNGDVPPTQTLFQDTTTICPNQQAIPVSATDTNGNVYTLSNRSDTLGRSSFGTQAGDNSGCVSSLPINNIDVTTYQGPNGVTNSIKTCFAQVTLQTSFGVSGIPDFPNQGSQAAGDPGSAYVPVTIILADGTKWTFTYDSYGNVTSIGLPLGGSISYQWGTVGLPSSSGMPPVSRAVTARTITDNQGHSATWTYQWMFQQFSPLSPNGSYTNRVTDPLGNDTLHVFTNLQGEFPETSTLIYQGASASGQLLKRVDTSYSVSVVGATTLQGESFTVLPISIQTTVYPGGKVSLVQKTYDQALHDPTSGTTSYGKVLSEKVYDWGQGAPGALLRETDTTYVWQNDARYLTAHLLDLPASVVTRDGSGNRVAETDYIYDEPQYLTAANISTQHGPPPAAVRGNLTTVSHWLNPGNSTISSHTNWYDTGEVYQQIDPLGNSTTHSYDAFYVGAYSTKTCNALNQCISGTYDFNTGLLASFTNANASSQASGNTPGDAAHTTNYAYDVLSRMTSATSPADPSGNHPQTSFNYPNATTFEALHKVTSSLTDDAFSYVDGLGRIIQTKHMLPGGSNALVDTTYDGLDQATSVSNPYFSTSELTYGVTQSQYDGLGRVTKTIRPDGSISSISYADNCTTTTDEAGKQRRACTDSLGRLTTVWEDPTGLNYETDYQYDALGNLLRVDQKGSAPTNSTQWRTRLFTYDSLSRLLTANNPESGLITYIYDANGNLTQKVMPSPNQTGTATHTISYCFDALNRITGKAYSWQNCQNGQLPSGTAAVSYRYDEGINGKGHLTSLTDQAGSALYNYDILGRISNESRTIAGVTKNMSYTYNLGASVATMTYPSGAVITYTPDSAGRLLSAVDNINSAYPINYVTGATYNAAGSLTGSVFGQNGSFAGITNTFVYTNRLQPCRMMASTTGAISPNCDASWGNVLDLRYDFHQGSGNNGNVYSIINYRDQSRNQTFTYDALNRLISAQNAGTDCSQRLPDGHTEYWGNNYIYDAWGNLNQKQVTKCSAENLSVTVTANNQLQGGYLYDAAGNMSRDNNGTNYFYDAENRISATSGFTYVYDADGNRVQKTNGSTSPATGMLYWYMTSGIVAESDLSGNLQSEYVFFGGERVARRDFPGNTVSYYLSDHLKTASVITDATGAIKSESDYYPWGGELQFANGDSNHYKFTGKERDVETGLDYFGARHYSNGLGRFITPDWSTVPVPVPYADLADPQSLNQYSYVRNIPTSNVDFDGHDCPTCPPPTLPTPTAEDIKLINEAGKGALAEEGVGAGISGGAILTGAAIVFGPAMLSPGTFPGGKAGQSDADERAAMQQASQERAAQNGGVDPQLGQARGAGEEHSQSDDARDKARTNGGLVKTDKGPGKVPKSQRDPKRSANRAERQQLLNKQGGKCPWCGKPTTIDKTATHHIKRHADGGRTIEPNLKAVCKNPCHIEIHK